MCRPRTNRCGPRRWPNPVRLEPWLPLSDQLRHQPNAANTLQVLRLGVERNRPKPKAPRSTVCAQAACGEFISPMCRNMRDYSKCVPANILTTVCYLIKFFLLPVFHPSVVPNCWTAYAAFPRAPHAVVVRIKIPAVGIRYRVTHGFPRRQYVATYVVRVVWGCNTFSGELQTFAHGNGADAAVRLDLSLIHI